VSDDAAPSRPEQTSVPTPGERQRVEALAGYGMPAAGIAKITGVDPEVLRTRYRSELDAGQLKANARVAENLFRKATGEGREAVTAAIFWLKTRAGWKETMVSEVTHDVADPIRSMMLRIAESGKRVYDRD